MQAQRRILHGILLGALVLSGCAAKPGPVSEASADVEGVEDGAGAQDTSTQAEPEPAASTPASTPKRRSAPRASPEARPSTPPPGEPAPPDPPAGVYHPLERGMTLYMLSKSYGVPLDTLMSVNQIVDPTTIPAGTRIFVPGATEMLPLKAPGGHQGPLFSWPLRGQVTSPFGSTSKRKRHAGLDIDGDSGEEILAAADGRVARIADNARYGLLVVLEHDGGYATWYGHASGLLVGKGDQVSRGQVIALVGRTGNAHGSHLHFEIRRNGTPVDPFPLLESRMASAQAGAQ